MYCYPRMQLRLGVWRGGRGSPEVRTVFLPWRAMSTQQVSQISLSTISTNLKIKAQVTRASRRGSLTKLRALDRFPYAGRISAAVWPHGSGPDVGRPEMVPFPLVSAYLIRNAKSTARI